MFDNDISIKLSLEKPMIKLLNNNFPEIFQREIIDSWITITIFFESEFQKFDVELICEHF